ncbi:hypothetical protein AB205_0130410, partial [Aquarana catesbeiana]
MTDSLPKIQLLIRSFRQLLSNFPPTNVGWQTSTFSVDSGLLSDFHIVCTQVCHIKVQSTNTHARNRCSPNTTLAEVHHTKHDISRRCPKGEAQRAEIPRSTSLRSCLLANNCVPFVCKTSSRHTPFGQKSGALSAENPIMCMRQTQLGYRSSLTGVFVGNGDYQYGPPSRNASCLSLLRFGILISASKQIRSENS